MLLFSMDFSVPELLGVCATGCKFLFEKASLCFPNCLCILVPNFPEKLNIAGAIRHSMFLCFSREVRSGVNQGLYLFMVLHVLNVACLFKMVRKALLKNNLASSTDGLRSISFQDTRARSIRKASSQKYFRERLTVMRGGHLTVDP